MDLAAGFAYAISKLCGHKSEDFMEYQQIVETPKGETVLLLRYKNLPHEYLQEIEDLKLGTLYLNRKNQGITIIKMVVSEEIEDDFWHIVSGRYSKLSERSKNLIIAIFGQEAKDALYPTFERRLELAQKLNVDVDLILETISSPNIFKIDI